MRSTVVLLVVLGLLATALPVSAAAATSLGAEPRCVGPPCDAINIACGLVKKGWTCVKASGDALLPGACAGEACDAINSACVRLFGARCVG